MSVRWELQQRGRMKLRVLTTGEAAHILERSSEQVRRYERTGLLPALRTQRGYRLFLTEDVNKLKRRLRGARHEMAEGQGSSR